MRALGSTEINRPAGLRFTARMHRAPSQCARCASTKGNLFALRTTSPHHRRPMMMDEKPTAFNPLIEIGRKNLALLSVFPLVARDVFHANDPGDITRYLDQNIGQFKFHGEGIVEDQDP